MSDQALTTRQLTDQAAAIAALAKDRGAFDAAVDTYIRADADGFRYVLGQQKLLERCELICEWIRAKWCVITCLRLCGPPRVDVKEPANIRILAGAIQKIVSDEALLSKVIDGIEDQDADCFAEVIKRLQLEEYCHYICSWFCAVLSERICRVVCAPQRIELPSAIESVRAAAAVIGKLASDGKRLEEAAQMARILDCDGLRKIIEGGQYGGCHIVCEWFCAWRCVFVCLWFCRFFELPKEGPVEDEIYAFAQAVGKLGTQTESLNTLAEAVRTANAEAFAAEVKRLGYEPFCAQLCRWICSWICVEYCVCVCPPTSTAIFTKIGGYYYDFDVNSALGGNGLTNDNRAFFNTMRLNGGYALVNGAPQLQYRFETVQTDAAGNPVGSWSPVLLSGIADTNIGTFVLPGPPFFQEVWVVSPSAPGSHHVPSPTVAVINPDPDGWITVPLMFPFPGVEFIPGSDLINFISQTLQAWLPADETGVMAGSSANLPLVSDNYYGIRMRLRNVGDLSDGSDAGTCVHCAIDDTLYNNVAHHTYWDGYTGAGELAVCSIGITELIPAGCAEITNSLTVVFTAAHPNLDANGVSIILVGPGGPYSFTLSPAAPGTPGNWFGSALPNGWTLSSLPDCAYYLQLSANVLLTTGDDVPSPIYDLFAFCKHA